MSYQHYYVNDNAQSTSGDHEVHHTECPFYPFIKKKTYLGYFDGCEDAMEEARKKYPFSADGCSTCSPACHDS
ncbi:MAG: hypothetical protein OXG15_03300 [Gammaproteobacteria bacterium]|nr:hypothetical protein [Gammaproteobacteria bacterium]